MEDAHAAVLDLQIESEKEFKAAGPDDRVSFFGVYDGHGGDKVAQYAGENIHKILAKQDAFKTKNFEQALKDGFLATDRAILSGMYAPPWHKTHPDLCLYRPQVRGRGLGVYRFSGAHLEYHDIRGRPERWLCETLMLRCNLRRTLAILVLFSGSEVEQSHYHTTISLRTKVRRELFLSDIRTLRS